MRIRDIALKPGLAIILTGTILTLSTPPSLASGIEGTPCARINNIKGVVKNKIYTCNYRNGKYRWSDNSKILDNNKVEISNNLKPLNILDNTQELENVIDEKIEVSWANFKKNKVTTKQKYKVYLQDGYTNEWEEITSKVVEYQMQIFEGNGFIMKRVPYFAFVDTEEERKKALLDSDCNANFMPNFELAIYCAASDIGSGGLRILKPGFDVKNGYQLTTQDKIALTYFISSELTIFYEAQIQYGTQMYNGVKNQIPAWLRAGTSSLIATLVTSDLIGSGSIKSDNTLIKSIVGEKPNSLCEKNLQDYEGKNKTLTSYCVFTQNYYATRLLTALSDGVPSLFKFDELYGKYEDNIDWVTDFYKSFGLKREEFYKIWYNYLGIPSTQFPLITAPTPAEHY